jgi:transposase-like protein
VRGGECPRPGCALGMARRPGATAGGRFQRCYRWSVYDSNGIPCGVFEHQDEYPSQSKAIESISAKLQVNHERLRKWVRRAEIDHTLPPSTQRSGLPVNPNRICRRHEYGLRTDPSERKRLRGEEPVAVQHVERVTPHRRRREVPGRQMAEPSIRGGVRRIGGLRGLVLGVVS